MALRATITAPIMSWTVLVRELGGWCRGGWELPGGLEGRWLLLTTSWLLFVKEVDGCAPRVDVMKWFARGVDVNYIGRESQCFNLPLVARVLPRGGANRNKIRSPTLDRGRWSDIIYIFFSKDKPCRHLTCHIRWWRSTNVTLGRVKLAMKRD